MSVSNNVGAIRLMVFVICAVICSEDSIKIALGSEDVPTGTIVAADVPKFMDGARCIACHAATEKRIGPPWQAISLRFHDSSASSVKFLAAKIIAGGGGDWGTVPMVANPKISLEQANVVATWILNLNPPSSQSAADASAAEATDKSAGGMPVTRASTVTVATSDGKAGRDVYAAHCAACHQSDGQGVKPTFPSLVGSKVVTGPLSGHILQVLKGRNAMPSFEAQLSNEEIAAVVTYERNAWGNHSGIATPKQVLLQRTK